MTIARLLTCIDSDWDGQHSGVASANAGLDIVMPDRGFWGGNLTDAVNNGSVSVDRLNDMVTRQLASYYLLGQENDYPDLGVYTNLQKHTPVNVQGDHAALIREVGAAGTILVKNVNNTLPLDNPTFLAVYGYDATVKSDQTVWMNPARYGGGKHSLPIDLNDAYMFQATRSTLAGRLSMVLSLSEVGAAATPRPTLSVHSRQFKNASQKLEVSCAGTFTPRIHTRHM